MNLNDLPTPCLVLDIAKVRINVERMHKHLDALGVTLRPHVKTCKSIDVARMMLNGQRGGIAVSTLREAEYFLEHGVSDITYAVGIAPGKLAQVAQLMARGADIKILLDDPSVAAMVSEFGRANSLTFATLIEIDCDGHRAGITPGSDRLLETASVLAHSPGAEFVGVLTHAGAAYDCRSTDAIVAMAETERRAITTAADRIRSAGVECPIVSLGSTPTASLSENLSGVTEVRAGVFVFQDLYQVGLGVCALDDIAVKVLTEVIGHQRERKLMAIDAGALALSKDRSTASLPHDLHYGLAHAANEDAATAHRLMVTNVYQEHGLVTMQTPSDDIDSYPIGSRLLVLPNHACMTVAPYPCYHVVDGDQTVVGTWHKVSGW